MQDDLVVDDRGILWSTNSIDLQFHLGSSLSALTQPEYLTKNLGYIRVVSRDGRAVITVRPSVVDERTVIALLYYLSDQHFKSLALQIFDDLDNRWRYEVLGEHFTALRKINVALEGEVGRKRASSFLSRETSVEAIDKTSPLRGGIDFYRDHSGRLSSHHLTSLSEHFSGRHMLYSVSSDAAQITLTSLAGSFPKPIHNYLYNAVGQDIRDRPDATYAEECAAAYASVARTNSPACFEVDAISKWSAGSSRIHRRYRRIILPFSDELGGQWLLGLSLPDDAVNLRSAAC